MVMVRLTRLVILFGLAWKIHGCALKTRLVTVERGEKSIGIFVDFKRFERSAVLDRLVDVGCREIHLWKSYFSGRSASIISSYIAATLAVTRGSPQGSVIGPFIWNLLMSCFSAWSHIAL